METEIAPGFLVAAPQLKDPFFKKTVIFMMDHHNEDGAMGLIINQAANVSLDDIISSLELDVGDVVDLSHHPPVMFGGPVSPELGWVIHTLDWQSKQTQTFKEAQVGVTASVELLKAILKGQGPKQYLLCLGYSGWGPVQLMNEMKTGSWLNVPFTKDLVFDVPLEQRWDQAISRLGIDPSAIAPTIGGA